MNKYYYFFVFLSPIVSLSILGIIAIYLIRKAKSIKPSPRDYILLINLERKFQKYFSISKLWYYAQELEKIFLNLAFKLLQRLKTEALKIQIWAEKHLHTIREKQKES